MTLQSTFGLLLVPTFCFSMSPGSPALLIKPPMPCPIFTMLLTGPSTRQSSSISTGRGAPLLLTVLPITRIISSLALTHASGALAPLALTLSFNQTGPVLSAGVFPPFPSFLGCSLSLFSLEPRLLFCFLFGLLVLGGLLLLMAPFSVLSSKPVSRLSPLPLS